MIKFCVKGDGGANSFYSSSIIIDNLNAGAKKVGLYDEKGQTVVYSTTCNDYGHAPSAIMCVYETVFPYPVLQLANGRAILGCSLQNLFFATDSYPASLVSYCPLGVDTNIFHPLKREKSNSRFRFLCFAESNARSGIDIILKAFRDLFNNNDNVELYLKDRGATDVFKNHVENLKVNYKLNIIHNTSNTQSFEDVKKIYSESDVHVFVSRSTTWGMTLLESMAMGLPIISVPYAGPREYLCDGFNGYAVKYKVEKITEQKIQQLNNWGFRNHMFPLRDYPKPPYWAEADEDSLKNCMTSALNEKDNLNYLSSNAIVTAEQFTWENAAVNLSYRLEFLATNVRRTFNRYS